MSKDDLRLWFYEKLFSCYPVIDNYDDNKLMWFYDDSFIRKCKISKLNNKEIKLPKKINGDCLFETDELNNIHCDYSRIWNFIGNNYTLNEYNDYETIQYIIKEFLIDYSTISNINKQLIDFNFFDTSRLSSYTPNANVTLEFKRDLYKGLKTNYTKIKNKNMDKALLTNFIERKSGLDIQEVTEVKIKDYDDEYGAINEHYIVDCKIIFEEYFGDNDTELEIIDKKCLVRVDEFKRYSENISSVIWL